MNGFKLIQCGKGYILMVLWMQFCFPGFSLGGKVMTGLDEQNSTHSLFLNGIFD